MAKKIHIKESFKNNISKFIKLVREQGINVSTTILFGSYAKGKSNFDSDIDLAVISNQFGKDSLQEMIFLRKIALKVDSRIEPIPLSNNDLNDKYSTLVQEIKKYGIKMVA